MSPRKRLPRSGPPGIVAGLLASLSFAAFVLAAGAGVPPARIPFAGELVEDGAPITATLPMTFRLYDDASPAASTFSYVEAHPAVAVVAGAFSVDIGSVAPLPAGALEARALFVSLEVDGRPLEGLIPVDAALHARGAVRARSPLVRLDLSVARDASLGGALSVAGSLVGDGNATLGAGLVEVGDGPLNDEAGDVAFDVGASGELTARRGDANPFVVSHYAGGDPLLAVYDDLDVNGDLEVTGTLYAGLRQVTCAYPSGASHGDCSCAPDEIAVGGGTYTNLVGANVKQGIRESRPLDLRTWRVACSQCTFTLFPFLDFCLAVGCPDIYVTCARLGG